MSQRPDHFEKWISPTVRFVAGLGLMILLLFQKSWWGALAQAAVFGLLGLLSGKRIRFGYFIFLAATITFFQLLSPMGRVLWSWGPLSVTETALWEGLRRGWNLVSLVFLSLFAISPRLRLPGSLGQLLARSFAYFEALTTTRKDLDPKDLVGSIDRLFERIHQAPQTQDQAPPVRTTAPGWIFLGGLTLVSVLLTMAP